MESRGLVRELRKEMEREQAKKVEMQNMLDSHKKVVHELQKNLGAERLAKEEAEKKAKKERLAQKQLKQKLEEELQSDLLQQPCIC